MYRGGRGKLHPTCHATGTDSGHQAALSSQIT